jgi:hypothetical protein
MYFAVVLAVGAKSAPSIASHKTRLIVIHMMFEEPTNLPQFATVGSTAQPAAIIPFLSESFPTRSPVRQLDRVA